MDYSTWNSPGQNTGVGRLSLLQGIFPTQESNPNLPHCRWILYQLSHKGSPRILEWVAHPFSRGSSWYRNWTGVFCVAGRFITSWATREAPSWGEEIKNAEWLNCLKLTAQQLGFPWQSVVRTLCFHFRKHRFDPLLELRSCMLCNTCTEKRKKQISNLK